MISEDHTIKTHLFNATAILLISYVVGCASVKTTAINRTDSDVFIGNSNGKPMAHCSARPFNGVPITVRVPTHVDVVIKEKILLLNTASRELRRVTPIQRHLFVETKIIETDKIFMVDVKRPAAGTLDYDMTFGVGKNAQYFDSLNSDIDDRTIKDITEAIKKVTDSAANIAKQAAGEPQREAEHLITDVRTVAWHRFDIDACDFELQLSAFVARHMNNCNSCQKYQATNALPQPSGMDLPNVEAVDPGYQGYDPGNTLVVPLEDLSAELVN